MPVFIKLFFVMYGFLWRVATLFLRHNKRLKDGWEQRNIPADWLAQIPILLNNILLEQDKDKPFFGEKILGNDLFSTDFNRNEFRTESYRDGQYDVDLWIQAASGGEAYLACELIRALPQDKRGMSILITTWTRQGMQVLERECEKIVRAWEEELLVKKGVAASDNPDNPGRLRQIPYIQIRFATLDKFDVVKRALDMANPRLCVMLETELWPHFMLACKEKETPLYVINARMTKTSYELYKIISTALNFVAPKYVLATTQDDMLRFSKILPSALVSCMPNIKFDKAADFVRERILQSYRQKNGEQIDANLEKMCQDVIEKSGVVSKEISGKTIGDIRPEHALPAASKAEKISNILQKDSQKTDILNKSNKMEFILSSEGISAQEAFDRKVYLNALPMLFSKVQNTFLFASVREEEENLLASMLWKIYPTKKNSLFIVAPRHMHRVRAWRRRFYDLGMRPLLASDFLKGKDFCHGINELYAFAPQYCVIWDVFGDLPHLYSHADMVFVGGSYKGLGGQNFLEALACGSIPHVGPDLDNFLWALGDDFPPSLKDSGLLFKHRNKHELQNALLLARECKKSESERLDVQLKFLEWVEPRCGASELAIKKILDDRAFSDFVKQAELLDEEI